MPFELHADYDRDGRLTASAAEYGKRTDAPGARILPNVDRDGRRLPDRPEGGDPVEPDHARPSAIAQDREPALIRVVVTPPDRPGDCALLLRPQGGLRHHVVLRDAKLRLIAPDPRARATDFPLPLAGASTDFHVETRTIGASPFADPAIAPRALTLELICRRPGAADAIVDAGRFEVPPLIVADDLAPAERLYIAAAQDDRHEPALSDVTRGLAGTGVPIVTVPVDQHFGDLWVQDQFQMGLVETGGRGLRILLHAPRARADTRWLGGSLNLAEFVRNHFRSTDLGVVDDLIDRVVPVRRVDGGAESLPLIASQHAYKEMRAVFAGRRRLLELATTLARALAEPSPWLQELGELELVPELTLAVAHEQVGTVADILVRLGDAITRAAPASLAPPQVALLLGRARVWRASADAAAPLVRPEVIGIPLDGSGKRIEIAAREADALFARLDRMHDSLGYGGNIECAPPSDEARRGTIVIGTAPSDDEGPVDADVLNLLIGQDAQPVIEVNSTWLEVAHVDEFMAFVPAPRAARGVALVRASPKLAADLVDGARRLYLSGLPLAHPHRNLGDLLPPGRATHAGAHPVTMMLRGKLWLHEHAVGAQAAREPPQLFRDLSLAMAFGFFDADWDDRDDRYVPGPLEESMRYPAGRREYQARMSVVEWGHVQDGHDTALEAFLLDAVVRPLRRAFSMWDFLKVPVLFDRLPWVPDGKGGSERDLRRTARAVLPDAANLQVVDDRVLVPRPYGPRMRPQDVRAVLEEAFAANAMDMPRLDDRWFARRGLADSVVWVNADLDWRLAGATNAGVHLPRILRDGFAHGTPLEDIAGVLRTRNPGAFRPDGALRPGWRRLIVPDGTVDVFEAAIAAELSTLGAVPRFVDSWHLHVLGGEIHCGTNVLRRART